MNQSHPTVVEQSSLEVQRQQSWEHILWKEWNGAVSCGSFSAAVDC
jgi:hypothetical protein